MQKFLVLYKMPINGLEDWAKTNPEIRKVAEEKMQQEWREWAKQHKEMLKETAGAGKTKLVSKAGVSDTKNDIMLFSLVEGESIDLVTKIFENHPHLSIPNGTIEIMPVNYLPGMKDF